MPLHPDRYLEVLRREGDRFADAAAGELERPVPSCPDWSVADLVAHLGVVHRHKERIVREGHTENPGIAGCEPPDDPGDLVGWYAEGLDLLHDTLRTADPDAPAWTWHAPDQTAGFWHRRMALETAVHRADAELGAGMPVTAVDADVAVDGIDEVLGPIMAAYTTDPEWAFVPDGRVVALETSVLHAVRRLHLGEGARGPGWIYRAGTNGAADVTIRARACDLYLWVWGRAPGEALTVEGDAALAGLVRETVARVT